MKCSPSTIFCLLFGSAVFAGIGWKLGKPAPVTFLPAPSEKRAAPALTASIAYNLDWNLRGDKAFPEVEEMVLAAAKLPGELPNGQALGLIASASPEEAQQLVKALLGAKPRNVKLLEAALARWTASQPREAIAFAKAELTAREFAAVRERLVEAWASVEPKAAHQWFLELWEEQRGKPMHGLEQVLNKLIFQWGLQDLPAAIAANNSQEEHRTYDAWYGLGHLAAMPSHREALFSEIAKLPEGKNRQRAYSAAMGAWANADAREAGLWLEQQPFGKDQDLQWSVVERWSRNINAKEAADYVMRNAEPNEQSRDRALMMALPGWAQEDPKAAAAWFEGQPHSDSGSSVLAASWARQDVSEALRWAMRVKESEEKRLEAIGQVLAIAQSKEPTFDPAAWTKQTGLSAEALKKAAEQGGNLRNSRL